MPLHITIANIMFFDLKKKEHADYKDTETKETPSPHTSMYVSSSGFLNEERKI